MSAPICSTCSNTIESDIAIVAAATCWRPYHLSCVRPAPTVVWFDPEERPLAELSHILCDPRWRLYMGLDIAPIVGLLAS